jgi:hypothetical protein
MIEEKEVKNNSYIFLLAFFAFLVLGSLIVEFNFVDLLYFVFMIYFFIRCYFITKNK